MGLLDLKSNLDNRNSFGGSRVTAIPNSANIDINGPAVNAADIIDGGAGETIEQQFFHGKANPGKGDGKKIGDLDLHVHMLNDSYQYNRDGVVRTAGPAPKTGNGVTDHFADLNLTINGDGTQNNPERYFDKMQGLGLL